jgi:hypothetical protein
MSAESQRCQFPAVSDPNGRIAEISVFLHGSTPRQAQTFQELAQRHKPFVNSHLVPLDVSCRERVLKM